MADCIVMKEISDEYENVKREISNILSTYICTIDGIKKRLKNQNMSNELIEHILESINAKRIFIDDDCYIEKLKYWKKKGFIFHIFEEVEGNFYMRLKYKCVYQDKNSNIDKKQIKKHLLELESKEISQWSLDNKYRQKFRVNQEEIILYVDGNEVKGSYYDKFGQCQWKHSIGKIETEKLVQKHV